eukprot:TRINITY_DN18021_c0_g1_i1.p1 TRINITY_DN18021_c0_g1~~TRINITY_DN18021_c0_g1_i1.p1  ORF type:complete len:1466 (+),score=301.15 TRINITY_DN18021_c0_g1_i1:110-4399(+)
MLESQSASWSPCVESELTMVEENAVANDARLREELASQRKCLEFQEHHHQVSNVSNVEELEDNAMFGDDDDIENEAEPLARARRRKRALLDLEASAEHAEGCLIELRAVAEHGAAQAQLQEATIRELRNELAAIRCTAEVSAQTATDVFNGPELEGPDQRDPKTLSKPLPQIPTELADFGWSVLVGKNPWETPEDEECFGVPRLRRRRWRAETAKVMEVETSAASSSSSLASFPQHEAICKIEGLRDLSRFLEEMREAAEHKHRTTVALEAAAEHERLYLEREQRLALACEELEKQRDTSSRQALVSERRIVDLQQSLISAARKHNGEKLALEHRCEEKTGQIQHLRMRVAEEEETVRVVRREELLEARCYEEGCEEKDCGEVNPLSRHEDLAALNKLQSVFASQQVSELREATAHDASHQAPHDDTSQHRRRRRRQPRRRRDQLEEEDEGEDREWADERQEHFRLWEAHSEAVVADLQRRLATASEEAAAREDRLVEVSSDLSSCQAALLGSEVSSQRLIRQLQRHSTAARHAAACLGQEVEATAEKASAQLHAQRQESFAEKEALRDRMATTESQLESATTELARLRAIVAVGTGSITAAAEGVKAESMLGSSDANRLPSLTPCIRATDAVVTRGGVVFSEVEQCEVWRLASVAARLEEQLEGSRRHAAAAERLSAAFRRENAALRRRAKDPVAAADKARTNSSPSALRTGDSREDGGSRVCAVYEKTVIDHSTGIAVDGAGDTACSSGGDASLGQPTGSAVARRRNVMTSAEQIHNETIQLLKDASFRRDRSRFEDASTTSCGGRRSCSLIQQSDEVQGSPVAWFDTSLILLVWLAWCRVFSGRACNSIENLEGDGDKHRLGYSTHRLVAWLIELRGSTSSVETLRRVVAMWARHAAKVWRYAWQLEAEEARAEALRNLCSAGVSERLLAALVLGGWRNATIKGARQERIAEAMRLQTSHVSGLTLCRRAVGRLRSRLDTSLLATIICTWRQIVRQLVCCRAFCQARSLRVAVFLHVDLIAHVVTAWQSFTRRQAECSVAKSSRCSWACMVLQRGFDSGLAKRSLEAWLWEIIGRRHEAEVKFHMENIGSMKEAVFRCIEHLVIRAHYRTVACQTLAAWRFHVAQSAVSLEIVGQATKRNEQHAQWLNRAAVTAERHLRVTLLHQAVVAWHCSSTSLRDASAAIGLRSPFDCRLAKGSVSTTSSSADGAKASGLSLPPPPRVIVHKVTPMIPGIEASPCSQPATLSRTSQVIAGSGPGAFVRNGDCCIGGGFDCQGACRRVTAVAVGGSPFAASPLPPPLPHHSTAPPSPMRLPLSSPSPPAVVWASPTNSQTFAWQSPAAVGRDGVREAHIVSTANSPRATPTRPVVAMASARTAYRGAPRNGGTPERRGVALAMLYARGANVALLQDALRVWRWSTEACEVFSP